jgi:hypothetical protein
VIRWYNASRQVLSQSSSGSINDIPPFVYDF